MCGSLVAQWAPILAQKKKVEEPDITPGALLPRLMMSGPGRVVNFRPTFQIHAGGNEDRRLINMLKHAPLSSSASLTELVHRTGPNVAIARTANVNFRSLGSLHVGVLLAQRAHSGAEKKNEVEEPEITHSWRSAAKIDDV